MTKLLSNVAQTISTIFNPFLLFAPIQILYFFQCNLLPEQSFTLSIIILLQALCPFVIILLFMKLKLISDFEITNKSERSVYFSILTVLFVIAAVVSAVPQDLHNILIINTSLATSLFFITIINKFWKISGHTTLDTILLLGLILNNQILLPLILIVSIVAWSRTTLHKHNFLQVLCGMVMGGIIFAIITICFQ